MKTKWKIILGAVVIVIAAVIIGVHFLTGAEVDVHEVARGNLEDTFSEDGVLVSEDERIVYSVLQAVIKEVTVKEGEQVQQDDLLVVLDSQEVEYSLEDVKSQKQALAKEIKQAEDSLVRAEDHYDRIQTLYNRDWASRLELEEAEAKKQEVHTMIETLKAKEKSYEAQIDTLQCRLSYHRIHAPIEGIVTHLEAQEKSPAGPQRPLMRILGSKGPEEPILELKTRVLTRDVLDMYVGQEVALSFSLREEEKRFSGEIIRIAPLAEEALSPLGIEEERVTVTILPFLPGEVTLLPGFKVEVTFTTREEENVLTVPKRALFRYNGEDALMVAEGARARLRKVKTGMETQRRVVIEEGLEEGDLVILDPQREGVTDGGRVDYD